MSSDTTQHKKAFIILSRVVFATRAGISSRRYLDVVGEGREDSDHGVHVVDASHRAQSLHQRHLVVVLGMVVHHHPEHGGACRQRGQSTSTVWCCLRTEQFTWLCGDTPTGTWW